MNIYIYKYGYIYIYSDTHVSFVTVVNDDRWLIVDLIGTRRILSTHGTRDHYRNKTWEDRNIGKTSPSALGGAVTVASGYTTTVAGVISCSSGDYYHTGWCPPVISWLYSVDISINNPNCPSKPWS